MNLALNHSSEIRDRFVDKYIFGHSSARDIETVSLSNIEKAYPLSDFSNSSKVVEYGNSIPCYKLALYFIEIGAFSYCQDLVYRMGERMPENTGSTLLNVYHENFAMASHIMQVMANRIAQDAWLVCKERSFLAFMIEESKAQFNKFKLNNPNPFEAAHIGATLFSLGDFELFEMYCRGIDEQRIGSTIKNSKNLFMPLDRDLIDLQAKVIKAYASNIKNLNQSAVCESVESFWRLASPCLQKLAVNNNKTIIKALLDSSKQINVTSINNSRSFILNRKAFSVTSGLLHLGAIAKNAGVSLNESDYKSILAPLSDIGRTSGTAWLQALDSESLAKVKENLSVLLDGFSPTNAPIGKISKGMASSLSEITGDMRWMGKLRLTERGQALEDRLGI